MSWVAVSWAKGTRGHRTPTHRLVLMVLGDYYNNKLGYAFPSQRQLAEDIEVTQRTIQRCLMDLAKDGFLSRKKSGNKTYYILHLDDESIRRTRRVSKPKVYDTGVVSIRRTRRTPIYSINHKEPQYNTNDKKWFTTLRECVEHSAKGNCPKLGLDFNDKNIELTEHEYSDLSLSEQALLATAWLEDPSRGRTLKNRTSMRHFFTKWLTNARNGYRSKRNGTLSVVVPEPVKDYGAAALRYGNDDQRRIHGGSP